MLKYYFDIEILKRSCNRVRVLLGLSKPVWSCVMAPFLTWESDLSHQEGRSSEASRKIRSFHIFSFEDSIIFHPTAEIVDLTLDGLFAAEDDATSTVGFFKIRVKEA